MRDLASTWNNLLIAFLSIFLLTVALVQSALRKDLFIAPSIDRINTVTLGKSYWYILPVHGTIYLNIAFVDFLLIVALVQNALRKKLLIAPFVERINIVTLGNS